MDATFKEWYVNSKMGENCRHVLQCATYAGARIQIWKIAPKTNGNALYCFSTVSMSDVRYFGLYVGGINYLVSY